MTRSGFTVRQNIAAINKGESPTVSLRIPYYVALHHEVFCIQDLTVGCIVLYASGVAQGPYKQVG